MAKLIRCKVTDEYVQGAGVVIGAAGSHNDVTIELAFSEIWEDTTKQVVWHNALGQNPTIILLTLDMRTEEGSYLVSVPFEAKEIEGDCSMTVKGAKTDGEVETFATLTTTAYFRVLPSAWDANAEESEDLTPSQAVLIQNQLDTLIPKIDIAVGAVNAANEAIAAKDLAVTAAGSAQASADAAAASAENAARSAENVYSYVNRAESAADTAESAAGTAVASAGSAEASAALASDRANAAANSASVATSEANSAKTSASQASTSAQNADAAKSAAVSAQQVAQASATAASAAQEAAEKARDEAQSIVGGDYLPLSGGTMTGPLALAGDPVIAMQATTKQYVDSRTHTYTVTVTTDWLEGDDGGYTQSVDVNGVLATDNPIADIVMGEDAEANELYATAWGCINRIVTDDDIVFLYANGDAPATAFTMQLKVVR